MKNYLFILSSVFAFSASAQQIALSSQYVFNEMLVNPGATGSKDYIPVQISYRKQWVNFPGSPTTQAISSHALISEKMGFGGTIFNDVAGPSRRTGVNINTSYHLQLDAKNDHRLGLGLGVSLTQRMIDVTQLTTYLPEDPAVLRGFNNQLVPDANFGVYYHFKNKAFAGLSAHNLVELKRDLYSFETPFVNPLERTYYFLGGYNFSFGENWGMKASTLVQMIETGTTQFDVTALMTFREILWFGPSYRNLDAVAFLVGGQAGRFKFGYSYDYTFSDIGDYSAGSHELFLEIQFNNSGKSNSTNASTPWLKRNRIYSPN